MAVYLSKEERVLVGRYAKGPDRPTYYSAAAEKEIQISDEMEAFIILAPPEARNNVVKWIKDSNKKSKDKSDRESLLSEALEGDLSDANRQLDEVQNSLKNYESFIESYFQNVIPETGASGSQLKPKRDRFADVVEVGQSLADLSRVVDEFLIVQDRAKHLRVVSTVLQSILSRGTASAAEKRQVSSWATPFTAYTNGRS